MVEYGAVSGPNCGSKSKDLAASDNTIQGNQIASFRDLLLGKSKSKQKSKDRAASDNNRNRQVNNQVTAFRNLLFKGIH
jgi:hypothetical protein